VMPLFCQPNRSCRAVNAGSRYGNPRSHNPLSTILRSKKISSSNDWNIK
jgi:hypothetical protein